jgi:nucleotide-binding universal stress UspA family protein
MPPPVILIPLDGSQEAETVLPDAEATARAMGHNLRLLGIVNSVTAERAESTPPALDFPAMRRREELEDYLHGMARALQQRGTMAEVLVLCGEPQAALQDAVAAPEVLFTVMARPRDGRCTSSLPRSVHMPDASVPGSR